MKWVLENFQVLIVIAGTIAYWLNQRRREKEGLPADYDEDGKPENRPTRTDFDPATMEAEEADRTRRLQEELRRKREQRSAGAPLAPYERTAESPRPIPAPQRRESAPPPVFQDPMAELMKELARKMATKPAPPPVPAPAPVRVQVEDEEVLENQRRLQQQYAALELRKKALQKQRADLATRSAAAEPTVSQETASPLGSWLGELRDPLKVRRALVMNEILGKPVALRG